MGLLNIVLFAALIAASYAEIADFKDCSEVSTDICKVSQVRITPCTKKGEVCPLAQGSDVALSFDFTPNFEASKMQTLVYWDNNGIEVPFRNFGSNDACLYTKCPTAASQQQTLNYNLHIGKKLPKGTFPLKWKTWNEDDETQQCCFKTTIRIKKGTRLL